MKSASTKPLRDKAQFCGASKRKINAREDFFDDKLMSQSSNDGIILNSSPKVKETSIGEGPKVWKYLPFALVCYCNIETD